MKISISTFLILFILGFLPVSCLWICKEFYIGKYDIELKTSSAIASGNLTYDSTRIVTGIETDSVLNSSYFFGCSVRTISKKIASVSSINFTNYSQCYSTRLPSCNDSVTARFNIDSIHVFCDKLFNGVPAYNLLDSNSIQFSFNLQSQIYNDYFYQNKYKDFNALVSYLSTYHTYLILKVNSKKPADNFESNFSFGLEIKKPTDSNLTKFFIKIYLKNGTVLTTESRKIFWL
ncbi:MAG TPA: hypothetical protein PK431_00060 [Chitinophagales bacterium]|nr:hypothetical protein [Chitinophagales bacterium]